MGEKKSDEKKELNQLIKQRNALNAEIDKVLNGKLHSWQKEFKIRDGLTTKDILDLEHAIAQSRLPTAANETLMGMHMRLTAAIDAKWIESPDCHQSTEGEYFYDGKDVNKLPPGAVLWLGNQINRAYNEAITVPLAI